MKKFLILFYLVGLCTLVQANVNKLSPLVREAASIAEQSARIHNSKAAQVFNRTIIAFVKADDVKVLEENGCKIYADLGDLFIASIPLGRINNLAEIESVHRISADKTMSVTNDTTATIIGASKVWEGFNLPQAFSGNGVVVGVQDLGFDFTHPTFKGRIKKVWDMLSRDTVGSTLPVGREYDEKEIPLIQHSYDGLGFTHGTHTAGTAAGSGYNGKYSGMAPGCDIVLVASLFADNLKLVDTADVYKYTTATDVLGFKYMFDYAESQGKPCVVSYSAGSRESFYDDNIYAEAIEKIVGPGKIFVASAGNSGNEKTYLQKEDPQKPEYIKMSSRKAANYYIKSKAFVDNTIYVDTVKLIYTTEELMSKEEATMRDTVETSHGSVHVAVKKYSSCWDSTSNVYEITVDTTKIGFDYTTTDPDAAAYVHSGSIDDSRAAKSYNVGIPGSVPAAICVGAVGYVDSFTNYKGEKQYFDGGKNGGLAFYSSRGPSYSGEIKPDVVAPGSNIVSSYSSFYLEQNPEASDIASDVEHFEYEGRIYPWNSNAGTSMSTPVVAGAIALWLQANPTLTKDDIIDVFAHTNKHHAQSLEYPNSLYGYGEIDVYNGLLYILGLQGIVSPKMVNPSIFPLREGETMTIYTVDGKQVKEMEHGVYAIQIKSDDPTRCGSMLIRK